MLGVRKEVEAAGAGAASNDPNQESIGGGV